MKSIPQLMLHQLAFMYGFVIRSYMPSAKPFSASKKKTNSLEIASLIEFPPLSDTKLQDLELIPTTMKIAQSKKESITNLLSHALESLSTYDFSSAEKEFRQLASQIHHLEMTTSQKGKIHERNQLNDLTGKQWLRHTKSWVVMDGKPGSITKEIENHPASFPPELAEHFISYFTKTEGVVLDPFLGIGSTVEACVNLNRQFMGIELNPEYYQYAVKRIKFADGMEISSHSEKMMRLALQKNAYHLFQGDARQAHKFWHANHLPLIDFVFTSPPYWDMLHHSRGGVQSTLKQRTAKGMDQTYSASTQDLGNLNDYDEYLKTLVSIFKNIKPMLKDKAYMMVVLQNCRLKGGTFMPIAWDFAQALSQHFELRQEFIWCQDQKFMGIWGYPSTYVSNVHHHYCLVFQKS